MKIYVIQQVFSCKGSDYHNQWEWYFTDNDKAWTFFVDLVHEWERKPDSSKYTETDASCMGRTGCNREFHFIEYQSRVSGHNVQFKLFSAITL